MHGVPKEKIKKDWGEHASLSDSNYGLKVVSNLVVEKDCAAGGVEQHLDGLNETLLDFKIPENLPQAVKPQSVKCFLEVNKGVEQVSLMLQVFFH